MIGTGLMCEGTNAPMIPWLGVMLFLFISLLYLDLSYRKLNPIVYVCVKCKN